MTDEDLTEAECAVPEYPEGDDEDKTASAVDPHGGALDAITDIDAPVQRLPDA